MFGHSDDNQQADGQTAQNNDNTDDSSTTSTDLIIPNDESTEDAVPTSMPSSNDYNIDSASTDLPVAEEPNTSPPVLPVNDPFSSSSTSSDPLPKDDTPISPAATTNDQDADLLDLKQKALLELSPLVGHLDQTPEEKFKTMMMMIQASDNQSLLSEAYKAAQTISDEKAKAQALLDVVNEINYFTQAH